jgi:REP element-mobilizing transposase RayT
MGAYTKLTYHLVFGTKYRRPLIREEFRERLYEYIGGTIRELDGHLIEIGGIEDHVHILANFTPARAVSDMIRDIKANASRWLNKLAEVTARFEWQKGYAAFTVSYSQVPLVRRYVRNQRDHHRVTTFEEEYIAFLRRHDIEFEPQWLEPSTTDDCWRRCRGSVGHAGETESQHATFYTLIRMPMRVLYPISEMPTATSHIQDTIP